MFNYLILTITCPRCGIESEMEAEFRFGLMDLTRYRIGDQIQWDGLGTRKPLKHPDGGNYTDEAYVVCPSCKRDFWLDVSVKKGIIVSTTINKAKKPYISGE